MKLNLNACCKPRYRYLLLIFLCSYSYQVWGGSKYGYQCAEYEISCVQNYNKNLNKSNGNKSVVVAPINFEDTSWSPSTSAMRRTMNNINSFFKGASRNKFQFTNISVRSAQTVPVEKRCSNRSKAAGHLTGTQKYSYRVLSYPKGTCGFSNAGGKTVNMNSGNIHNRMTMSHEFGHLFRLTHSRYYEGKCGRRRDRDGLCPDPTTYLGYHTPGNRNYNAVDLHWMGWLEKHEVERIVPEKYEYNLRAINRNIQYGEAPLALVFDIPHTGNRMYISMPKSATAIKEGEDWLKTHDFNIYIASPCKSCMFQKSVLVKRFKGSYVDETGLNIEVVDVVNKSEAVLAISYQPEMATCDIEPEYLVSANLLKAKTNKREGKIRVKVTTKNHNSAGCRPYFLYGGVGAVFTNEEGERLTSKQGIRIKKPHKGYSYVWPEQDLENKKYKGRRTNTAVFDVSSRKSVESGVLKVRVGDLEPVDVELNFRDQ